MQHCWIWLAYRNYRIVKEARMLYKLVLTSCRLNKFSSYCFSQIPFPPKSYFTDTMIVLSFNIIKRFFRLRPYFTVYRRRSNFLYLLRRDRFTNLRNDVQRDRKHVCRLVLKARRQIQIQSKYPELRLLLNFNTGWNNFWMTFYSTLYWLISVITWTLLGVWCFQ